MLIPFRQLLFKYKKIPTGIIHLGAHIGEESVQYDECGIDNVIWIEGNPEIFKILNDNIKKYPKNISFNAIVSDVDNQDVKFNITNNNESSSILELDLHKLHHPHIYVTNIIEGKTITLDTLFENEKINTSKFNFLNIDLQGAELKALKGFVKNLPHIEMIYTEVNKNTLYKDCALIDELDSFLTKYGFERVETVFTEYEWGDAYYIKK